MGYIKNIYAVILIFNFYVSINGLYPDSNYGREYQQQLYRQLTQYQRQQNTQNQQRYGQGLTTSATRLNIILPKAIIDDFEYIPTVQGYRLSYQLKDGTKREEEAYITGVRMDDYSRLDSKTTDFTAVGVGGRPKMKLKNRKLSPGSLKSLSG